METVEETESDAIEQAYKLLATDQTAVVSVVAVLKTFKAVTKVEEVE